MADPTTQAPAAPAAPVPGSPEHNAAMVQKFEQRNGGTPTEPAAASAPAAADRPAWLPENFQTPEAFLASYKGLQAKVTELANKAKSPVPSPASGAPGTPPDASAALAAAGIDMGAMAQEYWSKGDLSDESYAALEKSGIDRETVKNYADGQRALLNQRTDAAHKTVGGKLQYEAMAKWAAANVDQEVLAQYNDAVLHGTTKQLQFAVKSLHSQFVGAAGSDPALLQGGSAGSPHGYRSTEEMKADMRDPRYKKDPAFRKDVMDKLAVSNI